MLKFFRLQNMAFICLILAGILLASPAFAQEKNYRVGYIEGGSYWLFSDSLQAVKDSLQARGWLEKIDFPGDAHYSPGWDRDELLEEEARELMQRDDLDLVLAAGTDATRAILAANNHETPIVAMAVSDPVDSGFVKSTQDSGVDNFTVRLDPERYPRMFDIFHQIVEFDRLGVIYPDTESGRQFTNLGAARRIAAERGFELLEYDRITTESVQDCLEGIRHLLDKGMDAFFIPSLLAFDWESSDVDKILSFLREQGIPTFARNGSRDVEAGALMGFSTVDFSRRGNFLSQMIIDILEGKQPRSLNMVDRGAPKISFNIQVANEIGFNPPFELLAATDELYREISLPEDRLVE
ncbi:ABC transporter substrate binding protein [Desulfonatronospira sp. MSAO_Bac3]|uniref:ABC transporter substrate-binding protein n=1 Tax=Desulfonatronospira sp. MSAO_Bac3 TaxID=2293857 RepID=UPI00257A0C01|nr:ABC transporter substrate binding protein [Desulfonatronospira sp. MSAO_Bac3]